MDMDNTKQDNNLLNSKAASLPERAKIVQQSQLKNKKKKQKALRLNEPSQTSIAGVVGEEMETHDKKSLQSPKKKRAKMNKSQRNAADSASLISDKNKLTSLCQKRKKIEGDERKGTRRDPSIFDGYSKHFYESHVLPGKPCPRKKINHAGNFDIVNYREITPKKSTKNRTMKNNSMTVGQKKPMLQPGQKMLVTCQPLPTIDTVTRSCIPASNFRVVGHILSSDGQVQLHHLEGPLPLNFLQRGISNGGTEYRIGKPEYRFKGIEDHYYEDGQDVNMDEILKALDSM